MVQLFSSFNITDITYVKHLLEEADIKYYIHDEHASSILPHMTTAIGGIKIMVADNDYENARGVIENNIDKIETPIEKHVYTNSKEIKCPECGSNNIINSNKNRKLLTLILSLFFMFPFPVKKKYFQCQECNTYWKINELSPLKLVIVITIAICLILLILIRL